MKEEENLQNVVRVIKECSNKRSLDMNIFDSTPEDADKAWNILGKNYKRHDTMQTDCFVTHLSAEDVCGYKSDEIVLFRNKEKGGDEK